MSTPEPENVVIRQPNPGQGTGETRAISARTAWQYEHDETNAQIDTIEAKIAEIREAEGVVQGDPAIKKGVTFSWTSDTQGREGNIKLATSWLDQRSKLWHNQWWIIDTDGVITEEGTD